MIHVKATIQGEPDVLPFTRLFEYDDQVFFSTASMVREKLLHNLKLNVNEALMLYAAHVVKACRAGESTLNIQKSARKLLSRDKVMIGVPETLQTIHFEVGTARANSHPRTVILDKLIPTGGYVMASP